MKKIKYLLLLLVLCITFAVRLYRINNPIADWHAWRQADTSAVSRNFVKYGFDILHPKYDDISNIQTGFDNPNGYRFVEFPIFNIAQAGLFKLFGHFSLEEWGRLVTVSVSVFSALFIYLIARRHSNTIAAFFSAVFFALDPYSIYYGRTILPDPSMIMAVLGGIYFFDLWLDGKSDSIKSRIVQQFLPILAFLFIASALLLKPYAIFFTLPMLWLAWQKFGIKVLKQWRLYVFTIFSILPLIAWRWWISHYPEGIPVYVWLFNGGNIRFTGAFFYWLFAERISKLILGYWGIAIVLLGFLSSQVLRQNRKKANHIFFLSFALSSLIYICVIARGNVQHDYYQILIIPSLALFFGLGANFLLAKSESINRYAAYIVLGVCSIFALAFGWYQVRDYFNINNPSLIIAGQAVDRLTPKNAKVIAPLDGDTTLLYYTNRKGWPAFEHSLQDLIKLGADYLVLANPKKQDYDLAKQYKLISSSSDYVLYDLHAKP